MLSVKPISTFLCTMTIICSASFSMDDRSHRKDSMDSDGTEYIEKLMTDNEFPDDIRFLNTSGNLTSLQYTANEIISYCIRDHSLHGYSIDSWNNFVEAIFYYDGVMVDNDKCKPGEFVASVANALRHAKPYKNRSEIGYGYYVDGWYHNQALLEISHALQVHLPSYLSSTESQGIERSRLSTIAHLGEITRSNSRSNNYHN